MIASNALHAHLDADNYNCYYKEKRNIYNRSRSTFPTIYFDNQYSILLDNCSSSPSNMLKSLEVGPAKYPKDVKVSNDYAPGLGCFDSYYNSFYNSSWNNFKKELFKS